MKKEGIKKVDKQTRSVLMVAVLAVGLTILTVYLFGVLMPSL